MTLILNDIHVGFSRSAGTTPQSQSTLRTYLYSQLGAMLERDDNTLCILGDLFDQFEVSPRDWIETYLLLSKWLTSAADRSLTLVAGNHDHSPKAEKVSSFEMLCQVLVQEYPHDVKVIGINDYDNVMGTNMLALAHCANQDIFNQKLDEIGENFKNSWLLLHANYDNNFAVESDHSLNVSEEQAKSLIAKGFKLVFAHEHQARTLLKGGVVVLGNQWPTSVADCLNNDSKFAHVIEGDEITPVQTWSINDEAAPFRLVNWTELADLDLSTPGFVRVTGDATRTQAAEVVNAIAKFRSKSEAFVVTNAVKIDGIVEAQELPKSFEAAKKFDVMEFIAKHLDEAEMAVVKKLSEAK